MIRWVIYKQVCTELKNFTGPCKLLVLTLAPKVYSSITGKTTPQETCEELKLCSKSPKAAAAQRHVQAAAVLALALVLIFVLAILVLVLAILAVRRSACSLCRLFFQPDVLAGCLRHAQTILC